MKLKRLVFKSGNFPCQALAVDRDGRPDHDRTGRPMCTGRAQRPSDLAGRPCGRPTEVSPLSGAAGRPGGRPFTLARSTGRSTGGLNGQKCDRWPVDRPVDRKGILALFSCQRANFPCQTLTVDRTVVGRPDRSTDVHKDVHAGQLVWPIDRAVDRLKSTHSRVARSTGRSTGQRAVALWFWARSTAAAGSTVKNLTVGRSTGRSTRRPIWALSAANGQILLRAIYTPFESWF